MILEIAFQRLAVGTSNSINDYHSLLCCSVQCQSGNSSQRKMSLATVVTAF